MVTVRTKSEFQEAIRNREPLIRVVGSLANDFRKKKKKSNVTKAAGVLGIIGSLAALPFTGGASAAGIIAGGTALTVGTVTISALEIVAIIGGTVAIIGVLRGAKVKFNSDGSVEVEPKYK